MRNNFKCIYTAEPITHIEGFYEMVESGTKWNIHHRLETHRWSKKQQKWILRDEQVPAKVLKALGLYYNRPASELIYLSPSEHNKLHCSIPRQLGVEKGKAPHNKGMRKQKPRFLNTRKHTITLDDLEINLLGIKELTSLV